MAITVTVQPKKLSLNKNPILLGLQTTNRYLVAPVKASGKFVFQARPALDDTITIEVMGQIYVYTFKNDSTADASLLQIKRDNTFTYLTIPAWLAAEVIPCLLQSDYIRTYYKLSVEYDGVYYFVQFEAYNYGEEYELQLSDSGSNISSSTTSPSNGTVRSNYKLYCDVYATRSYMGINAVKVASLEAEPDADGKVLFQIQPTLVVEDNPAPTSKTFNSTSTAVHLRYFLYFGDKYGTPVIKQVAQTIGLSASKYVLNGALADDVWQTSAFYDIIKNSGTIRFLNLHPRKLTVSRLQPLWLYYFAENDLASISLKCKLYKTDGTSSTVTLSTQNLFGGSIAAFNTSVYFHDDIEDCEDLYKYEVWLEADSVLFSEKVTYIISEFEFEHNRYFLYRNSWGGYETIWCHGKADQANTFDYEQATVFIPGDSSTILPSSIKYGSSFVKSVSVNTGIKGREDEFDGKQYRDYLADFFNSEEVYELVGTKKLPVELLVKDEPFGSDLETVYNQGFKYKYSLKNKGFTPDWI